MFKTYIVYLRLSYFWHFATLTGMCKRFDQTEDPEISKVRARSGWSPTLKSWNPMPSCLGDGFRMITLWLFNIAMENVPFIDDFPINTSIYKGFSMAMLNYQRVTVFSIFGVPQRPFRRWTLRVSPSESLGGIWELRWPGVGEWPGESTW